MWAPAFALALLSSAAPAGLELEPCTLATPGLATIHARCGTIVADDGAHIGFAVLAATGHKKKPDPVVLLPGGPGQAFTELAAFGEIMLAPAERDRDLILFDPRGTGRSQKLACPDDRPLAERLAATDEAEAARLAACARGLALDPRAITTARIVKDLEAVRVALGVSTWNLFGVSYGTRLGLAYDRAYPGKARTLVLDSVVPFSMRVGETAASDALAALADIDARCSKVAGCREQPLGDILARLRADLDAHPRGITVADPRTGKPTTPHVTGKMLAGTLRTLLYSDATAALVPQLLRAANQGDLAPLVAQIFLGDKMGDSISVPMQLSVLCAEDIAFLPEASPEDALPLGGFIREMKALCAVWPHAELKDDIHADTPTSSTPALLLSGTADPVTPPRWAAAAQKTLVNARRVVAVGLGHNVAPNGCVPEQIAGFIDDPAGPSPTAACTASLGPFPLFIDAMGPSP